jgi:hypothetical protein
VTYYMHTLDGMPAGFFDGRRVCFTRKRVPLATSLRQIRREQAISKANDDDRVQFEYGYVTVTTPKR